MYLCYVDESGVPDTSGNTSHFVLAGLSVPVWYWGNCDKEINLIKKNYALENSEVHAAWLLRFYQEQNQVPNFSALSYFERRSKVEVIRRAKLLKLLKVNPKSYKQTRKNYRQTEAYIHLTFDERCSFVKSLAQCVSAWGFARLFAECIDKIHFDPIKTGKTINEQAFEQVVSRFEQYLGYISGEGGQHRGLLIHDNNETVSKKHTELMKHYLQKGTLWTEITHIIETPLFVNSELTSMIQIADVCGYSLRRYLENGEEELFDLVFQRADRKDETVVGVRHFTNPACTCKICVAHKKSSRPVIELPVIGDIE